MFAFKSATKAFIPLLSILLVTGCGSGGTTGSAVDSAYAQPEKVSASALKAAVTDDASRRFYEGNGWSAVWNRESESQLNTALEQSVAHGLKRDLFVDGTLPADPAEREAALTKAALDYASALAVGFVDPKKLRDVYTLARPEFDPATGLSQAMSGNGIDPWLQSLAPQTAEYKKMSETLVQYLREAGNGEDTEIRSGDAIHAGDRDPRVPQLAEALSTNGYWSPPESRDQSNATLYTPAMASALKALQRNYGIKDDGVVGPETLQVLNAGAGDRARQLAVNLERLRWLERNPPETRIDVNTASTMLEYWRDGQLRNERKVVVGQPDWETPRLGSPMFQLVANPTWTVPESIEEEEIAPKGPGYLEANNMVRENGHIVQQPGPDNALGQVKFDMRNDHAIYLHDTPAKALFSENERHRSHGCVRVENAVGFAGLIARDDGILDQFSKAMATKDQKFVKLKTEIPVRLMYRTAFVDRGGQLRLRADAYGWDDEVAVALGLAKRDTRRLQSRSRDIGP